MPVTAGTAEQLSTAVIRLMKVITSMRAHAPRLHPAVDSTHYPLLFTLGMDPRRVSALAECVHSDVSTVSRQVTHLVQQGLIEKIDDPQDGRAQVLSLTTEGRDLIARIVTARGEWFRRLLAGWTDEEARRFLADLDRFVADVEAIKTTLGAGPGAQSPAAEATTPDSASTVSTVSTVSTAKEN